MKCPDCNERPLKLFNGKFNKRCTPCTTIYYRQLRVIKDNELRKEAINNKTGERTCKHCGELFITNTNNQKYCYNPCNAKQVRVEKSNSSWLSGKKYAQQRKVLSI